MSIPASTTAEQDVRRLHSDGHREHENDPGEMAIGVIIGRTAEFFDFFVFSVACVLVFPARLFPFVDPLTGTLYSFGILGLAFIARPFGSLYFHHVDRTRGRAAKLTLAMFILGMSTVAVGLIPRYDLIGWWSIAILIVFRLGQGFALGGTWDGMASLLALNAPERKRGWYAMIPQLGAPIALIVVTGLFIYLLASMSAVDFLDWGWRYPFFVAFAINIVALFSRLRIVATPEYEDLFKKNELSPTSLRATCRTEGRHMLTGIFTPLASFALFHMMTVFPLGYVFLFTDSTPVDFLIMLFVGAVVGFFATALSGILSDRIGRSKLLIGATIGTAIFAIMGPIMLNLSGAGQTLYVLVGFALLGLSFGQASGAVASSFGRANRYTASSFTSDMAWVFGAGFAPLVALYLTSQLGLWAAGLYLLSGAVCTLVALRVNRMMGDMGRA